MGFWQMLQIVIDIVFAAGFVVVGIRLTRPQKDDPRMSRGLQLLQSKISVLEDLSDRTETQATQLTALMDAKIREVQRMIEHAESSMNKIDKGIDRSLEVAQIFQDKIPHQEIIERQNTVKFVKAAKMAHQGASAQEIARKVNLSMAEIEFIIKVNREQLSFDEAQLPEWLTAELQRDEPADSVQAHRTAEIFQRETLDFFDELEPQSAPQPGKVEAQSRSVAMPNQKAVQNNSPSMAGRVRELGVRPVQFEKIAIPKL